VNLKTITTIFISITLTGCLATYPKIEKSDNTAFLKFERNMAAPLLGSISRYVKVDDKQDCNQGYVEHTLLAVQNTGNPLVSDLNLDGLYVKPGDYRILINTVAGPGAWCDVFVKLDIEAGKKYRIVANGNMRSGRGSCSASLYTQTADGTPYKKSKFKKYYECNK